MITKSKEDTTHNRRVVFSKLRSKDAVSELFREVAPKVGDRPGGYTRVIKLGSRLGDAAEMAMIELVDYNETYGVDKPKKKKSTRRAGKKTSEAPAQPKAEAPKKEEAKAEEKKDDKKEE